MKTKQKQPFFVIRGVGWRDVAFDARCAWRVRSVPWLRSLNLGLRPVVRMKDQR